MKPGQHEYKVMGLAPYGAQYHGQRSLDFFNTVNRVAGTEIVNNGTVPDLYFTVREALRAERFDGIAWGIQTWLEELLCEWVTNNVAHHGTGNVILSGGVAQNIKAVKALAELQCVEQIWAGPISGDGSIGVGAAWLASNTLAPEVTIEGLPTVYLGTEHSDLSVRRAVEEHDLQSGFYITERPSPQQQAEWLAAGQILARFSGRMEFGQRALGNRSILGDPRRADTVDHVNQKIKYRDFWMPFTPSMTTAAAERMLINPKGLYSPFMTMAFDLQDGVAAGVPAVIHPADKTARAQMLKRELNPGYHDLLCAFGALSGYECLMNTSFNLHGDAIVESPDDAIDTFLRSELDTLVFDDVAISRAQP